MVETYKIHIQDFKSKMAWSWTSATEDPNDCSKYTHEPDLGDRRLRCNLHRRLLEKKQSTKFIWVVGEAPLLQMKYEGIIRRRIRSKTHERPEASTTIEPPSPELHRLLVKIEAKSPSSLSLSLISFFRWKCKRFFRWSGSLLSCRSLLSFRSKWCPSCWKPNTAWHVLARPAYFSGVETHAQISPATILHGPGQWSRFQIVISTSTWE